MLLNGSGTCERMLALLRAPRSRIFKDPRKVLMVKARAKLCRLSKKVYWKVETWSIQIETWKTIVPIIGL